MKHSISQRIRVTKNGKVMRRAMGLGHSRASKSSREMQRKLNARTLNIPSNTIKKYI